MELPNTSAMVGCRRADARVRSRKTLPPGMKISFWVGQIRAAGLDQRDRRQAVLLGDLGGPEALLHRPRVARAALDRRVVGGDQALDALDHADAGDQRGADGEVRAPARQRRELQERRPRVDEQLDPLARQELPARVVALDVLRPPPPTALACSASRSASFSSIASRLVALTPRAPPSSARAWSACRARWCARAAARGPPVEPHRQRRLEPEVLRDLRAAAVGLEPVAPVVDRSRRRCRRRTRRPRSARTWSPGTATSTSGPRRCASRVP